MCVYAYRYQHLRLKFELKKSYEEKMKTIVLVNIERKQTQSVDSAVSALLGTDRKKKCTKISNNS